MPELPDLLRMRPYFREMVWGGRKLQDLYGKELPPGRPIGESFELSAYPGRESVVAEGELSGLPVSRLLEEYGARLVGREVWEKYGGDFPLLIKLLDPRQDLSIQVHPDDAYAREKGLGESGKMEAWYVLHSEEGRVACGLREGVDREEFARAVSSGRIEEVIRFHPVEAGDLIFLPPGTVHALCRGTVVYEVQQPSDITFRIYDYGRLGLDGKPRELHLEQALEVIDFGARPPEPVSWKALSDARAEQIPLVESECFRLVLCRPESGRTDHASGDSFLALTLIRGTVELSGKRGRCVLKAGETVLVPACREFSVGQREEGCSYLLASPAVTADEPV